MFVIVWHAEDEGATGATGPFDNEDNAKFYVEIAWDEFCDDTPEEGEWTHQGTWQDKDGMWDFATVLPMSKPDDFT